MTNHNIEGNEVMGDFGLVEKAKPIIAVKNKTDDILKKNEQKEDSLQKNNQGKKIGEILIENGVISQENFLNALRKQKESENQGAKIPFLQLLVELNYIEPQKFLKVARENNIYVPMGEILVMEELITNSQLNSALKIQKESPGKKLGEILIEELKLITEETLIMVLSKQYGNLRIKPDTSYFNSKIFFSIPKDSVLTKEFIPYNLYEDENKKKVIIVLVNDVKRSDLEEIKKMVLIGAERIHYGIKDIEIEFGISSKTEIIDFINNVYKEKDFYINKKKLKVEDYLTNQQSDTRIFHIGKEYTSDSEIILVFSSIIKKGLDYGASDIHIEPNENKLRIRYRIDGVLKWDSDLPINMKDSLMRGMKNVLSFKDAHKLDKTFDERFKVYYVDKKIHADLRVSVLPLLNGDKMVMRILVQSLEVPSFTDLGMKKNIRIKFQKVCTMSSGIIIVTGPTGSGKTTTLFATINYLKDDKINIVTIEDPPEYIISGINQAKVGSGEEKTGINYLDALKSTLRQDPDVIMFGEMRDNESASVAMSAGMTGHLLFTTLHTNDAVSSITRLADLGIRPFMLSSTLVSIMAQRLVRKICPNCKEEYNPSDDDLEFFRVTIDGIDELIDSKTIKFHRGKGCEKCRFTGYKGRVGIYELLCVNEVLKKAVLNNCTAKEIEDIAREFGMTSMVEDGFIKVLDGQTTPEEIIRVSRTLQAPKRKRNIDEIRYLLEGELSKDEIASSIYSGLEKENLFFNQQNSQKFGGQRNSMFITDDDIDNFDIKPIIGGSMDPDLFRTGSIGQYQKISNTFQEIDSSDIMVIPGNEESLKDIGFGINGLCQHIRTEVNKKIDKMTLEAQRLGDYDKIIKLSALLGEFDKNN